MEKHLILNPPDTSFDPNLASDDDIALLERVFGAAAKHPMRIPGALLDYFVDYVNTTRLTIPIGQVVGFSQYAAQSAPKIATNESTTSTSYADLATVGPQLSGLPAGQYLFWFGAYARISANTGAARMSIDVNGSGAVDGDQAAWNVTDAAPGSTAAIKVLPSPSNTVIAKYRVDAGLTGFFAERWLIALKYAN